MASIKKKAPEKKRNIMTKAGTKTATARSKKMMRTATPRTNASSGAYSAASPHRASSPSVAVKRKEW